MNTIIETIAMIGELESRITHGGRTESEHKMAGLRKVGELLSKAAERKRYNRTSMQRALAKQAGTGGRLVLP